MSTQGRLFRIGAFIACLLATPAVMAANRSYELGLEAAGSYRYSEALMHFRSAAEQSDRAAQRNLGLMLLYGDLLYGSELRRNVEQAKRWLTAAAAQGCETSSFVLSGMLQRRQ